MNEAELVNREHKKLEEHEAILERCVSYEEFHELEQRVEELIRICKVLAKGEIQVSEELLKRE